MNHEYYLYIMASKRRGALYVGMTSNLVERVRLHKAYRYDLFNSQYNITQLVYYERHPDLSSACARERVVKASHRLEKLELIEAFNPDWRDLESGLVERRTSALREGAGEQELDQFALTG